jgi:hypothetical protein
MIMSFARSVMKRNGRGLWLVPVAGHDDRPLDEHLARVTLGDLVAVGVDDGQVDHRHRGTDRVGAFDGVLAGDDGRHRAGLGQAIGVGRAGDVGEGLPDLPLELVGRRRAAEGHGGHGAGVVVVAGGVLTDPPDHGGNGGPDGDAVVLNQLERAVRIEAAFGDDQLHAGDHPHDQAAVAAGHVEEG